MKAAFVFPKPRLPTALERKGAPRVHSGLNDVSATNLREPKKPSDRVSHGPLQLVHAAQQGERVLTGGLRFLTRPGRRGGPRLRK